MRDFNPLHCTSMLGTLKQHSYVTINNAKRIFSLDWGIIGPGTNSTMRVYVRNEGNSAVYLWMETSNWKPSVSLSFMTLIWTYSGTILNADEVVPIDLILNVSPTVSGITDFSFDIVITAG